MTARLLRKLDELIAANTGSILADCASAKKALHLVRVGRGDAAKEILEALHRKNDLKPDARVSSWIHLVEGLMCLYLGVPGRPDDKLKRSLAIATAIGEPEIAALACAWSAHLAYGAYDIDGLRNHLTRALMLATAENHQALARAKLIGAVALHLANRLDLAQRWYSEVHTHAVEEGDDATVSALMHNRSCMCVANMRQLALDPFFSSSVHQASLGPSALLEATATASYDELIGASSLSTWVPILRAQAYALQGEYARALSLYEENIATAAEQGLDRVMGYMRADVAWCRLQAGRKDDVLEDARVAEASLESEIVLVDDRAATRCRLAAIYGALGLTEEASRQSDIARSDWVEFRALQQELVAAVGPLAR